MSNSPSIDNAQCLTLKNGLRVLYFYQPDCQQQAVSVAIKAGHFFDPSQCQGLAHLLEHMLFMGHSSMPRPNAINEFIEQAGGSMNAYTATELANFHIHCNAKSLSIVLCELGNMLATPLLNPEKVASEIEAIEAEFEFKRKDDLRRLYQIHKETANPAHPFSQFSVGNKLIFNQFTHDELTMMLKEYHKEYYCGANMTLSIVSSLPFDKVRGSIEDSFGQLPKGREARLTLPPLYLPEQLGIQINIKPLQHARRMIVTFALPAINQHCRTRPIQYLSHLLGDEGRGSLFSFLKAKGWITNLIAGSGIEGENFKDFNVSFQLTQEGLSHHLAIIDALFYAIELIKLSFNDPWRFKEKARLNALARQYDDTVKPLDFACQHAELLQSHTFDEIVLLSAMEEYNEPILHEAIAYFTPENMRVKVISQDVETSKTCNYYDAQYGIVPLDNQLLQKWHSPTPVNAMFLPEQNPYIADSYTLTLAEPAYKVPRALINETGMQIWFAQDQQFHSPKGDIYLSFDSAALTQNIHQVAAKRLWLATLNDFLQAKYYRAEIAGLHYRLYGHQGGFTLHTRGFTAQQTQLASQLLDDIFAFSPDAQTFHQMKALQCQSLQNALLNKPTNRLFSRLSVLIQRNTHAPVELLGAVEQCQFDDIKTIRNRALSFYHIDGLMHGNWSSDNALHFIEDVKKQCSNANANQLSREVVRLPVEQTLYHEVICEHDDAAVILYLQAPGSDCYNTAMCMVLEQMLAGPFFNELRTNKQLGYVVGTGYVPHNQHPGMAFYIQSPAYSPSILLQQMSEFLKSQVDEIDLYRQYWPNIQQNLLKQLQEKDLNQSMKSQRLWLSLGMLDMEFNRAKQLAATVAKMTFDDIQLYAQRMVTRQVFGELVLYAPGRFDTIIPPIENQIKHIADFKSTASYFL